MAMNFRRHQIMKKLGIEQLPTSIVTDKTEAVMLEHDFNIPIRPQMISAPDCEEQRPEAAKPDVHYACDGPSPEGPLNDMTVRDFSSAVPARKCPTCASNGVTTWVLPGKQCGKCYSVVD